MEYILIAIVVIATAPFIVDIVYAVKSKKDKSVVSKPAPSKKPSPPRTPPALPALKVVTPKKTTAKKTTAKKTSKKPTTAKK
jgi:hypothetical protein